MNSQVDNSSHAVDQPRRVAKNRSLLILATLLLLMLACNLPLRGPTPPADRTPAAQTPIADLFSVIENARAGDVLSLTFTEGQLTQLIAAAVQQNQTDISIDNPSVVLRNNQMEIYGRAATDVVSANFLVSLAVTAGDQGQLNTEILSANFGGVPVPDSIRAQLQGILDNALREALVTAAGRFRVSQVVISDGLLTLNGTVQ